MRVAGAFVLALLAADAERVIGESAGQLCDRRGHGEKVPTSALFLAVEIKSKERRCDRCGIVCQRIKG